MLELSMGAMLTDLSPALTFEGSDHLPHLHSDGSLRGRYDTDTPTGTCTRPLLAVERLVSGLPPTPAGPASEEAVGEVPSSGRPKSRLVSASRSRRPTCSAARRSS